MFTGLVETTGTLAQIFDQHPGKRFAIEAGIVATDASIGDSICINGCCLTVVEIQAGQLHFEAGEETLSRTNLGQLQVGSKVNLERSLAVGDRLGGHYVTGHVDALGSLIERTEDPPWANLRFSIPTHLASQVAGKGSIAIDGISLTVVDVDEDSFSVALIPHTLAETTLGERKVGDKVNLETDVLAKYVQRSLGVNSPDMKSLDMKSQGVKSQGIDSQT
ncbi:Riboflavin synthase [Rubripirellula obstinata]|uniref:Riboflavin synthase n=1 Tax=Rubripirellula obstinata TaxID=406547 RepID=A0A5B1CH51_9BACT|nr:riboflavin synthase [Rubripirellula obstinata]KAA1258900.1 Riboflavin synthase [Rubripirellula obstinata]